MTPRADPTFYGVYSPEGDLVAVEKSPREAWEEAAYFEHGYTISATQSVRRTLRRRGWRIAWGTFAPGETSWNL